MTEPIVYIDSSSIYKGKENEVEDAVKDLTVFVKRNMPRLLYYGFFFNIDRSKMSVVAIHSDSASIVNHMNRGEK